MAKKKKKGTSLPHGNVPPAAALTLRSHRCSALPTAGALGDGRVMCPSRSFPLGSTQGFCPAHPPIVTLLPISLANTYKGHGQHQCPAAFESPALMTRYTFTAGSPQIQRGLNPHLWHQSKKPLSDLPLGPLLGDEIGKSWCICYTAISLGQAL